ncbi:MAG: hypothetical protein QOJ89_4831, partial [bacterium]
GNEHPAPEMVTAHKQPEDLPALLPRDVAVPSDWRLQDAEALHAEHPRSFFIPPAPRRRGLEPGELVKLGFEYGPHADRLDEGHIERMWVQVLEQASGGQLHGRLRNNPARLTELELGDLVAFDASNVLTIDFSDEELGYAQDQWPVVDEAIGRDDRAPDVVVRAPGPDTAAEDEWWMLCRDDPGALTIESVGLMTDRFPGLEQPLRAGDGVWELAGGEHGGARWRRVGDDELGAAEWRELLVWLDRTARSMRAAGDGR